MSCLLPAVRSRIGVSIPSSILRSLVRSCPFEHLVVHIDDCDDSAATLRIIVRFCVRLLVPVVHHDGTLAPDDRLDPWLFSLRGLLHPLYVDCRVVIDILPLCMIDVKECTGAQRGNIRSGSNQSVPVRPDGAGPDKTDGSK